ncbi:tellurium resistance protein TerC [Deltaproteobacteria bacterium Smac51]|nr:tellurium resistance protein TerC [Deltaproteobacteria bacterium Smac51]
MLGEYSLAEVAIFCVIVVAALLVDLFAHKSDEAISLKNAAIWSVIWVSLGLGFAAYVGLTHGREQSYLYLAGYLLEKSLSVDNLFVFMAIFSSFSVKDEYQHRVLYYGIIGALILRLIFVAAGASLLALFDKWALTAFGLFVLWSAWKMWQESQKPDDEIVDYTHHWAVSLAGKVMPVSNRLDGHNFFTKIDNRWHLTPLFLCLVTVEVADVMFAFDSVPAIIAITQEPFLVYTSNIFAILGLRSMYFLLAAAKRYLCHLEKSVIIILAFIGLKMLVQVFANIHIKPMYSLAVVIGLLAFGVIGSIVFPEKPEKPEDSEKPETPEGGTK